MAIATHSLVVTLADRARDALAPLIASPSAPDAFPGRAYECLGPGDPLREEAERATEDLESLPLHERTNLDVDTALAKVTTGWIEAQVEAAILQSSPERVLSELGAHGDTEELICPPPQPVAHLRVPGLTFQPLIDAVDANARRLAHDPAQRELRAQTLVATDGRGRVLDRAFARRLAYEVAERLELESAAALGDRARRRLEELARAHARRARYASAFALAARRLERAGKPIDAVRLAHAFDAVAGLDKIPFRRGPSEHLTPELLAVMALEFYRALADPEYVVSFLLLTFPFKNSSGLRTNVATEAADFGEVLMLLQLRRFLEFLSALGLRCVRFICLTDGIVYARYLNPGDPTPSLFYRENVRQFRNALGLAERVLIVDADQLLRRVPRFAEALVRVHAALARAEVERPRVRRKLLSLTRSFLFHLRTAGENPVLMARVVNACFRGHELSNPHERAEQRRLWERATTEARWYAAHLLLMSALDVVRALVAVPHIRATVHPKPGQFAPAPVNVRDFTDLPYHRKPLLRAGSDPLNLDTYVGANLWADPSLRFVDVYVGANRSPFLGVRL